jgi:hypothetical protein
LLIHVVVFFIASTRPGSDISTTASSFRITSSFSTRCDFIFFHVGFFFVFVRDRDILALYIEAGLGVLSNLEGAFLPPLDKLWIFYPEAALPTLDQEVEIHAFIPGQGPAESFISTSPSRRVPPRAESIIRTLRDLACSD